MDEEAIGAIPCPPSHLDAPNVLEMAPGKLLHRVHSRTFPGYAFNPCRGGQTRFAPILDEDDHCIPSLYAGDTVAAAIYETLFHDIPLDARRKTVPRSMVENRKHSTLLVRRALRLANLRAPDLMKWDIDPGTLIGSSPRHYEKTTLWAKAVHDQFSHVDGLIWTSRLCDPDSALLFFGDRVGAADIEVAGVRDGADASFLHDVREAGNRGNIMITL